MSNSESKRETHAFRNPETGLIEILDLKTGQVVGVQKDPTDLFKKRQDLMVQVATPQGLVWMQKGLNPDHLGTRGPAASWPYSEVMADLICQKIAEGAYITKIGEEPGFPPYSVICRWRRESDDFKERLDMAYKDRAEFFHDKALQEAEREYYEWDPKANDYRRDKNGDRVPRPPSAESTQQAKMRFQALTWAAEKGSPERFGNRTHHTEKREFTAKLVIETGIRRPGDPGFDEAIAEARAVDLLQESKDSQGVLPPGDSRPKDET